VAERTDPREFAAFLRGALWDDSLPRPDRPAGAEHHHHHAAIRLELPPMSESALRQWLLALPREVLRAKGLVELDDGGMCYFQRTDDEFARPTLLRVETVPDAAPCAVLIGPGLDAKALGATLPPAYRPLPPVRIPNIPSL
jgi:G3E family GTPase